MKKERIKIVVVLMVALALVGSASLALAGGWGRGMGGMGQGYGKMGFQGMGGGPYAGALSAEQLQNLQPIREAYLKEVTPLQTQLFTKKNELRMLWSTASPDQDQILAKQREINELQQQLQEKAIQHQLQVRASLSN